MRQRQNEEVFVLALKQLATVLLAVLAGTGERERRRLRHLSANAQHHVRGGAAARRLAGLQENGVDAEAPRRSYRDE